MNKTQRRFTYDGFGFPVVLENVPMMKARGVWTPNVDYNALAKALLQVLAQHPSRLTGAEVRFIRHYFQLTLQRFAERFAVSHPAVIKWEKAQQQPTGMGWATEKDIRLFILTELGSPAKGIVGAYRQLATPAQAEPVTIRMDLAA